MAFDRYFNDEPLYFRPAKEKSEMPHLELSRKKVKSPGGILDSCFEVKTCWCLPLRIGCLYVSLLSAVMCTFGAYFIVITITNNWDSLESVRLAGEFGLVLLFFFADFNFLMLLASICLFFGVCTRRKLLVAVYVWSLVIYLMIANVVLALAVLTCAMMNEVFTLLVIAVAGILGSTIGTYFFVVTNSFRMQLRRFA